MKERPILFSGETVRAILEGRKTQTRRACKFRLGQDEVMTELRDGSLKRTEECSPYGKPGDRLWVRETWAKQEFHTQPLKIRYRADHDDEAGLPWSWKPSIHMPRWASRINLEITGIRVERVQDISEEDAEAEGVHGCDWGHGMDYGGKPCYCKPFEALWDSINAKRGYSWDSNPWVWVVEFKQA